jgi:hypothetical protein
VFWHVRRLHESRQQTAGTLEEYRSFWQQTLDRLGEYLKKIQREEKANGRKQ